jgi:hypothetical protein
MIPLDIRSKKLNESAEAMRKIDETLTGEEGLALAVISIPAVVDAVKNDDPVKARMNLMVAASALGVNLVAFHPANRQKDLDEAIGYFPHMVEYLERCALSHECDYHGDHGYDRVEWLLSASISHLTHVIAQN